MKISFLKNNRRSIMYSIIIVLGLVFLFNLERSNYFFLGALIIYLIVLFEMFYIWFVSKDKLRQLDLPLVTSYTKVKEFIHHIALPSLLFVAYVGFIYFNNDIPVRFPLIILALFSFTTLFINLKAFYLDKYQLEKNTYFIYDLIELQIYFGIVNIILNLVGGAFLIIILITLFSFVLLFLNIYQFDEVNRYFLTVVSILSVINFFLITFLIGISVFNQLALSVLLFQIYYFLFAILRHKVEGTLNRDILIEYFGIFLLSLGFFYGIFTSN